MNQPSIVINTISFCSAHFFSTDRVQQSTFSSITRQSFRNTFLCGCLVIPLQWLECQLSHFMRCAKEPNECPGFWWRKRNTIRKRDSRIRFFCSLLNLNQRVLADAGTRAGAGAGGVVLFDKWINAKTLFAQFSNATTLHCTIERQCSQTYKRWNEWERWGRGWMLCVCVFDNRVFAKYSNSFDFGCWLRVRQHQNQFHLCIFIVWD